MASLLRDARDALRHLMIARDNMVAAWPKSYYRREMIVEKLLGRRLVIVNLPAGVQHVLVSHADRYPKSPSNDQALRTLLGQGLFVSEGPLWLRQRRAVTPAVHTGRLPGYAAAIVQAGEEMLARWRARPAGFEVDVTEDFTLLTAEIISRIMFGFRLGEKVHELFDAFAAYQASHGRVHMAELLGLPNWLPRPSRLRGRRAVARFDRVIMEIIAAGRARNVTDFEEFLALLINFRDEQGRPMDPSLVRDEVASIFLAGHETTAITLGWASWLLETHPAVEERLVAEVRHVLGSRAPTIEDYPRLTYTRAVVEETLRLYPPVHVFSRRATADDEIAGVKIPRGTFVTISSWVLHRHKLWWEAPEKFDPERFLPPRAEKNERFAYIPFGAGPRICLGKHLGLMEAVLLLAMIVRDWRLTLRPGHPVEPLGRMTLRPRLGLPMRIAPRP
ncbi:MAG: cytochrome P450 [Opitutaceae bacterium]|nr:cytochrome P450 [Opitutaceae bacterium]